jgi:hypothetical protein
MSWCRVKKSGAYSLSDLTACDVFVMQSSDTVQVDDCADCVFLIGPVSGSVFLRDCKGCKCATPQDLSSSCCHIELASWGHIVVRRQDVDTLGFVCGVLLLPLQSL